jgi:hypothetical protein
MANNLAWFNAMAALFTYGYLEFVVENTVYIQ